jgi:WD40 repeat protein
LTLPSETLSPLVTDLPPPSPSRKTHIRYPVGMLPSRLRESLEWSCNVTANPTDISDIWSIAILPDCNLIAYGKLGVIQVWNLDTNVVKEVLHPAKKSSHPAPSVLGVSFSSDSKLIVSGSDDGQVRIWDTESGAVCHQVDEHYRPVTVVAFSLTRRVSSLTVQLG